MLFLKRNSINSIKFIQSIESLKKLMESIIWYDLTKKINLN
jgi:hypothetical protein